MDFACSRVTSTERLLHEALISVDRNTLRLIRVSMKKGRKIFLGAFGFLQNLSSPHVFISTAPIPG
jgi:hypothetical protein